MAWSAGWERMVAMEPIWEAKFRWQLRPAALPGRTGNGQQAAGIGRQEVGRCSLAPVAGDLSPDACRLSSPAAMPAPFSALDDCFRPHLPVLLDRLLQHQQRRRLEVVLDAQLAEH